MSGKQLERSCIVVDPLQSINLVGIVEGGDQADDAGRDENDGTDNDDQKAKCWFGSCAKPSGEDQHQPAKAEQPGLSRKRKHQAHETDCEQSTKKPVVGN